MRRSLQGLARRGHAAAAAPARRPLRLPATSAFAAASAPGACVSVDPCTLAHLALVAGTLEGWGLVHGECLMSALGRWCTAVHSVRPVVVAALGPWVAHPPRLQSMDGEPWRVAFRLQAARRTAAWVTLPAIGYAASGYRPNVSGCTPSAPLQLTAMAAALHQPHWVRTRSWRRPSNTYLMLIVTTTFL